MSEDQEESNASSEAGDPNGEMSEDQGVEEVEVDESIQRELHLPSAITFGGLLHNGIGTIIDSYQAVNRGLNKFIQPKYFAQLLFSAADSKMPWTTTEVPQKIMCNSVFVVSLRNLDAESSLFRDGLGSWIQNCGKVSNFFVWENDEVKEIKSGQVVETGQQVVEFVRRIDKNSSCTTYTRVTVIATALGYAALQYFFKGDVEQEFTISYHRPKKTNGSLANLSLVSQAAILSRTSRSGQKRKSSSIRDDEDGSCEPLSTLNIPRTVLSRVNNGLPKSVVVLPSINVSTGGSVPTLPGTIASTTIIAAGQTGKESLDIAPGTLIAYLREHIRNERVERVEDRKLRREEMEARRLERLEDRKVQREEMELRKKELQLQTMKWTAEQERWDIERKGRDVLFDIMLKKKSTDET